MRRAEACSSQYDRSPTPPLDPLATPEKLDLAWLQWAASEVQLRALLGLVLRLYPAASLAGPSLDQALRSRRPLFRDRTPPTLRSPHLQSHGVLEQPPPLPSPHRRSLGRHSSRRSDSPPSPHLRRRLHHPLLLLPRPHSHFIPRPPPLSLHDPRRPSIPRLGPPRLRWESHRRRPLLPLYLPRPNPLPHHHPPFHNPNPSKA